MAVPFQSARRIRTILIFEAQEVQLKVIAIHADKHCGTQPAKAFGLT